MKKKKGFRISISTKIIGLTVTVVVLSTALLAHQTSDFFRKVMVQREDYSNMSEAAALTREVEYLLGGALERSQIMGTLLMNENQEQLNLNFNKDKSIVSIEVWRVNGSSFEFVARKTKEEFLKEHQLNPDWISEVRKKLPFPMASVMQKNVEVRNSTLSEKSAVVTIGFPLKKNENESVTHIALADFQLSLVQKPFAKESERQFYMIDRNGVLLAHPDEKRVLAKENINGIPIVQKSLEDSVPRRQTRFVDPTSKEAFIGAYVKSPFWGITVFAQTAEEIILEPAKEVQRRSFYISGLVISASLFLCFLFSLTLTGPLEKLAELIRVVSKGNFDVKATMYVKSHDEVGDLAEVFDNMTEGLKERDKVKNVLSKFHGSAIAEDLIKGDMGVGGTKKDVTVFFSDIRGFTKFSESRSPEDVVSMLNEYFGVMVEIIHRNGGVVDKFIGDAIMAVWGAPQQSPEDPQKAVTACLEMREALSKLNQLRISRNEEPIMIGMGLHCGAAISGKIGSEERLEYTVIGDTVNMTSRIEASTKAFGSDLLVSDAVFLRVKDQFSLEKAGAAEVKGKSEPLTLYKVRGRIDANGTVVEVRTPYSDYEAESADKVKIAA